MLKTIPKFVKILIVEMNNQNSSKAKPYSANRVAL